MRTGQGEYPYGYYGVLYPSTQESNRTGAHAASRNQDISEDREWYTHARMIVQRWSVRANTLVVHLHSQQHQVLSPSIRPPSSQPLQAPQQDLPAIPRVKEVKVFQQGIRGI